jgi:hypothetical protein
VATPGYSGKPLADKLGLKAGQTLLFVNAPPEFGGWLGPLPGDVRVLARPAAGIDLAVVFTMASGDLAARFGKLAAKMADKGMIWVAWPKKTSGVKSDLTEDVVRAIGIDEGWVDVKVCAVSDVWSGLKFYRRKG